MEELTLVVEMLGQAWGAEMVPPAETVARFLDEARPMLGQCGLSMEDFAHFMAVRAGSPPKLEVARAADLALAFGCSRGKRPALDAFERAYGERLRGALRKMGLSSSDVEAAMQKARTELFVAPQGGQPKIARYGGQGELGGWLRVTVTRSALKMFRGARPEAIEEERLGAEIVGGAEPELAYMRELYRPVFRRAFREALVALGAEERLLLKQNMIDGVSIDRLAELHGVHRATIARRVARSRDLLIDETRKRFQAEARVSPRECESIFRALGDAFDVTLQRLSE